MPGLKPEAAEPRVDSKHVDRCRRRAAAVLEEGEDVLAAVRCKLPTKMALSQGKQLAGLLDQRAQRKEMEQAGIPLPGSSVFTLARTDRRLLVFKSGAWAGVRALYADLPLDAISIELGGSMQGWRLASLRLRDGETFTIQVARKYAESLVR